MLPESASQDYTIDEIQDVINIVRACVDRKAVSYPPDRDKTFSFAAQYQLNTNYCILLLRIFVILWLAEIPIKMELYYMFFLQQRI